LHNQLVAAHPVAGSDVLQPPEGGIVKADGDGFLFVWLGNKILHKTPSLALFYRIGRAIDRFIFHIIIGGKSRIHF
jgi:hypothetical protein